MKDYAKVKSIIKNLITFLFFTIVIISCSSTDPELIDATGTVKYISLEGGFYGIITDNGKSLDPINLPKEFQVDGKRVYVKYHSIKEGADFHMWGMIIEIVEIKELK